MGKINAGILGGFSGKVGNVVGAKWKGIDYMRLRVIPANPRTPAQTVVREKMAFAMALAKMNKVTVINPNFNHVVKSKSLSETNRFMSLTLKMLSPVDDFDKIPFSEGIVSPMVLSDAEYDEATSITTVTIDKNNFGYSSDDDEVMLFVGSESDTVLDVIKAYADGETRGTITPIAGTGMYRILPRNKWPVSGGKVFDCFIFAVCKNALGEVSVSTATPLVLVPIP